MSEMHASIMIIIILLTAGLLAVSAKLSLYKKQARDIARQVREFREKKTTKKINIETADKDMEGLACEINEFLELYKRSQQEKVAFEDALQQGIANMSHDLRTPLTSITGYLRLLEEGQMDKDEALRIIKSKTRKLNVLINDFFELASIESRDYELEMTKLNLTSMLSDEILAFHEAFERRGMQPCIDIPEKPVFINGDKDSLERVLGNLISNTLKHAEGDIQISLEECNGKAVLRISNTCAGIDKKDVAHMFDRFYMADKVRKGQGAGLGLSIVKSLVEKMNGSISSSLEQDRVTMTCQWETSHY